MIADLINGFVSREVLQRLNRARLIAIPKADGGVRPVATGEVFGKLAGIVLFQRYENALEPLFAPMQQGIMAKAGCEKIVHTLHERYCEGQSILSVDLKNAFNSPSRADIAKHVFGLSTLQPFQRFFLAEYAEASELLFYGSEGTLAGKVLSEAGVRQGSPLSTLYFCAYLQPILETLAAEHPEIEIHAYIDDINLTSHTPSEIAKAFERLKALLAESSIELSAQKCVWFGGLQGTEMPTSLKEVGVRNEEDATKILGAFIGKEETISEKLLQRVDKHKDIFRRLKSMGMSNASLIILSKCVNVRQQFHMRVHSPAATEKCAQLFDNQVEEVLETWLGKLQKQQMDIARLPIKKGGLGLTSCYHTREAAYNASRHAALKQRKSFSARATSTEARCTDSVNSVQKNTSPPPTDELATAAKLHEHAWNKLFNDPEIAPILRATTTKGSYDWLMSHTRYTLYSTPRF